MKYLLHIILVISCALIVSCGSSSSSEIVGEPEADPSSDAAGGGAVDSASTLTFDSDHYAVVSNSALEADGFGLKLKYFDDEIEFVLSKTYDEAITSQNVMAAVLGVNGTSDILNANILAAIKLPNGTFVIEDNTGIENSPFFDEEENDTHHFNETFSSVSVNQDELIYTIRFPMDSGDGVDYVLEKGKAQTIFYSIYNNSVLDANGDLVTANITIPKNVAVPFPECIVSDDCSDGKTCSATTRTCFLAADALRQISLSSELQKFIKSASFQLVNLDSTPSIKVDVVFQEPEAASYDGDLTSHWFGFGFNENEVMVGADFVVAFTSNSGENIGVFTFLDQHATGSQGRTLVTDDNQSDVTVSNGEDVVDESNGRNSMLVTVIKPLNNTSDQDFNIERGDIMNLLFSIGTLGDNNAVGVHSQRGATEIKIPAAD